MDKSKMKSKTEVELSYKIIKIQTAKFAHQEIEENHFKTLLASNDELSVNMNLNLNIDKEKSSISVDVTTSLIEKKSELILIEHTGRTIYNIKGLEKIYTSENDTFEIPDGLLIQLYSMAYTHSRALLAVELSPTMYKDNYFLPVVNPEMFIKKQNSDSN